MMARPASARRGQPILALVVILMIWMVARAAMWNPVFEIRPAQEQGSYFLPDVPRGRAALRSQFHRPAVAQVTTVNVKRALPSKVLVRVERPDRPFADIFRQPLPPDLWVEPTFVLAPRGGADSAGHIEIALKTRAWSNTALQPQHAKRWSFDQWVLMRASGGNPAQAVGAASYGASQAGAIARFRLGEAAPHSSFGYLRTSLAIDTPAKDKEMALGFGMRPVSRVPLRVLAEARVYGSKGSPVRVRPVVTVITELPWQELGAGWRAEAYGQAGYAGGAGPTAFFDAQGTIDRPIGKAFEPLRTVRLGAGIWAGGQKGAVRLDVGPRVAIPLDLGPDVSSRIALDWRLRVAGNARPVSGPALTLASSF